MRNATAGVLIAALSLLTISTLTACAPASTSCTDGLPGSDLATTIAVSGAKDALPTNASFATPLVASTTSSTVLTRGDGATVESGDAVSLTLTVFDGASGSIAAGDRLTLNTVGGDLPLAAAAVCAPVGSRVVAIGPAVELLGSFTSGIGLSDEQTVVIALDIDAAYPGRAEGHRVLPQNGLPTVSLAPDGRPGVSFTSAPAPSELRIEPLISGDGDIVQDGDQLVVQYTGIDYETHRVFDSTWTKQRPATLSTSSVVPGFAKAVIGQRVGSQILAVIPPSEGYGDSPSSPVGADEAMVFVIDILGIAPASGQ